MPLIAESKVKINGKFTFPTNEPADTKVVQFIGNQGSYGEATYKGRGIITTQEHQRVTVNTIFGVIKLPLCSNVLIHWYYTSDCTD